MTEVLHWLPIASHNKFKILLISNSQLGLAPKYLSDFMSKPISSTSGPPALYWSFRSFCPSHQDCLGSKSCFCSD